MYILKVRGTGKVPDYIQLRDDDLQLLANFKISSPKTALARCNLSDKLEMIIKIAHELDYGKVRKIEL